MSFGGCVICVLDECVWVCVWVGGWVFGWVGLVGCACEREKGREIFGNKEVLFSWYKTSSILTATHTGA